MMSEKIFKAYDIRGIYPTEIDEDSAYVIGRAYAIKTGAKKIVVGRDMRIASEALCKRFIDGVREEGRDVYDIGEMSVDALYFAFSYFHYDGGVFCTASHNPKDYHGFKMLSSGGAPVKGEDLKSLVFNLPKTLATAKGKYESGDVMKEFIGHLLSFVDVKKIKPLHVVIDAGNGMAGKIIPELAKHLPIAYDPLFFELDGNFPNHPSNPLEKESQVAITKKVIETKADCGVIFDGDTDRLFFIDEKGNFIRADITLLILARYLLAKNSKEGVVYNAICSHAVPHFIEKWGGKAYRSQVGWVHIKENMMKHKAILGGELSAHYSFRDNFYSDSGFIAFLMLLEHLSQENKPLSQVARSLVIYEKSDEINLKLEGIPEKIEAIKKKYASGKQDYLDGVTVEYENYWFNVRASNTEPLLRLTIEASNKDILQKKTNELIGFLQENNQQG